MTTEHGESRRTRCFGLCAGARNICERAGGRGSCSVRSTELGSPVRLSLRAPLLAFPDDDHAIELGLPVCGSVQTPLTVRALIRPKPANGHIGCISAAPTQNASDLAEMIANGTRGVTAVHKKIAVQEVKASY
jgi:hypothetical protein